MPLHSKKGSAAADVVIGAAMVVFVILPLFSAVIERFILMNKAQIAKDALDMTNMAVYNSIIAGQLGRTSVKFEAGGVLRIYRELLAENLKLDAEMDPLPGSIADGRVDIESIEIFTAGLPQKCPEGTELSRPSVHSCVNIPVKPALYRRIILDTLGREHIDMRVHMDSEIPLDR